MIEGTVAPGFEPVRDAFARNFTERGELGAACAVYLDGEPVVDLWGGIADHITGGPRSPSRRRCGSPARTTATTRSPTDSCCRRSCAG